MVEKRLFDDIEPTTATTTISVEEQEEISRKLAEKATQRTKSKKVKSTVAISEKVEDKVEIPQLAIVNKEDESNVVYLNEDKYYTYDRDGSIKKLFAGVFVQDLLARFKAFVHNGDFYIYHINIY